MADNIPIVIGQKNQQVFFNVVRNVLNTLMGKNRASVYDRALTVRDLEKIQINGTQIDMDIFLNSTKQDPYSL